MARISRSKLNIKIVILGLLICAAPAQAAEAVSVTKVEILNQDVNPSANIVLNDIMAIREIKIKGDIKTGNISLSYPDYINKQGRSIPQVEIVNESLAKTIRQAIVTGAPSQQKQVDFNYKIAKISLLRQKDQHLKAFVSVFFNATIKVEARVMESKTGLWVAWPGRKGSSGKWQDQFKILDYPASQKLDNMIVEKYKVVRSEEP